MRPVFSWFARPQNLFLLIAGLAGVLLCVFIPYGAGFDEESHVVRIFDLSRGHLLPNRYEGGKTQTFTSFFQISYQRRFLQTPAWDMLRPPLSERKLVVEDLFSEPTRSIYNPLIFLPQALMAGVVWRLGNVPIVWGVVLIRLSGFVLYLLLSYLAIRLIPLGKWVLFLLAALPTALFQAATLNTDGYTNAVAFLFVAQVLALHLQRGEVLSNRALLLLAGTILLVSCAKPGAVLLLPLLAFLPPRGLHKGQAAGLALVSLAGVALHVLWMAAAVRNSHLASGGGQSLTVQLGYLLSNPGEALLVLLRSSLPAGPLWLRDWMALYGHWVGKVPALVFPLLGAGLVSALLSNPQGLNLTGRARLGLAFVFLLGVGFSVGAYFAANYDPGQPFLMGRQGRYLLPWMPLFLLALWGITRPALVWQRMFPWLAGISLSFALLAYGYGLYATYYTYCGELAYTRSACAQPVYKHLDRASLPVLHRTSGEGVSQEIQPVCAWINGAEIWLQDKGPAQFRLSLVDERGTVLAERAGELSDSGEGAYQQLILTKPLETDGRGLEFRVTVEKGRIAIPFLTEDAGLAPLTVTGLEPGMRSSVYHYFCVPAPR